MTDEELSVLHDTSKKTWKKARLVGAIARNRGSTLERLNAAEAGGEIDPAVWQGSFTLPNNNLLNLAVNCNWQLEKPTHMCSGRKVGLISGVLHWGSPLGLGAW